MSEGHAISPRTASLSFGFRGNRMSRNSGRQRSDRHTHSLWRSDAHFTARRPRHRSKLFRSGRSQSALDSGLTTDPVSADRAGDPAVLLPASDRQGVGGLMGLGALKRVGEKPRFWLRQPRMPLGPQDAKWRAAKNRVFGGARAESRVASPCVGGTWHSGFWLKNAGGCMPERDPFAPDGPGGAWHAPRAVDRGRGRGQNARPGVGRRDGRREVPFCLRNGVLPCCVRCVL